MDELERRRPQTERSLATAGLLVTIAAGYLLRLPGSAGSTISDWTFVLVLTLAVQLVMWLVPHFGWDKYLPWDPHYMLSPMLAAVFLLNVYVYFAVDSRVRVLMLWFVALMFMAGLARFREVARLGGAMASGYVVAVARSPTAALKSDSPTKRARLRVLGHQPVRGDRVRPPPPRAARDAGPAAAAGRPRAHRRAHRVAQPAALRRGAPVRGGAGHPLRRRCSVALLDVDHFKNYNDRSATRPATPCSSTWARCCAAKCAPETWLRASEERSSRSSC